MQPSHRTVTVAEATLSYASYLQCFKRLQQCELEPPYALQMNYLSDFQVCSLYLQCFTEQRLFDAGTLAFYSSFHPHIRVLLLLFLAAFTPTLLVLLASYDSGLLIVFMA